MECIIYIRWSTTVQARGSSLERQTEDCRRHAAYKGWNVKDTLCDDGVSAYSGEHVQQASKLARFLDDAEAGKLPEGIILLTERLDRLSRQGYDELYFWMKRITAAGVILATVDGDKEYRPGRFALAEVMEILIKAEVAHDESAKKASRLAAAWKGKRKRLENGETFVMTARAPAWLRVEGSPRRFAVIPERAEIVRRIYEDTANGVGKATIARDLNREGVATFGRATGWHSSYVQKILAGTTVLGEMQAGSKARGGKRHFVGEPVAGYYPQIVDEGLHARALASMAGRARRTAGKGRRLVNLLSGLCKCRCGQSMTFRGKGAKRRASGEIVQEDYLVCDSYQRGRGCDNRTHYNYVALEVKVLNAVLSVALKDAHFSAPAEVVEIEKLIAKHVRLRDQTRVRATSAMKLHIDTNEAEPKAYWEELSALANAEDLEIDRLQGRLFAARGAVPPEEHAQRVLELRRSLEAPDEDLRFASRTRVMAALHELVTCIVFSMAEGRPHIEMTNRHDLGSSGKAVRISWSM